MTVLTVRQQKQALRKRMHALRDAAAPEQREAWSAIICARVLALPAYQSARAIHCYLPIRSEVDPRPIIEHALAHGKRVAIPIWQSDSDETLCYEIDTLAEDAYNVDKMGLRTPRRLLRMNPDELDLVLVPLLAFAQTSGTSLPDPFRAKGGETGFRLPAEHRTEGLRYMRLGYGAGFYDRFLRSVRARRVGLAFALQRVDDLPQVETDTLLDDVITEC
jgi:5-formyltetrahydrofolate cyclo-ligase